MISCIDIQLGTNCPKCMKVIESYGAVTDAPISVQMQDMVNGVKREYVANRHHCRDCNYMFDVVQVNRIYHND